MREQAVDAVEPVAITDGQLEKINALARRALSREEIFVFSLILCDNDVDRDYERFTEEALAGLRGLFIGKTGVFDHSATAGNQNARVFDAAVERPGGVNALGGELVQLRAWAYMARCAKNADLILEIDAGIKKEVSVGCAVGGISCSICGADIRAGGCMHEKGVAYGDVLCHHVLDEPTDAYEWSFVAVPAQKNAGVTKRRGSLTGNATLEKLFSGKGSAGLTGAELEALRAEYMALRAMAAVGERHMAENRDELTRLAVLTQPGMDRALAKAVAEKLDAEELERLTKVFARQAAQKLPVRPQLGRVADAPREDAAAGVYRV